MAVSKLSPKLVSKAVTAAISRVIAASKTLLVARYITPVPAAVKPISGLAYLIMD